MFDVGINIWSNCDGRCSVLSNQNKKKTMPIVSPFLADFGAKFIIVEQIKLTTIRTKTMQPEKKIKCPHHCFESMKFWLPARFSSLDTCPGHHCKSIPSPWLSSSTVLVLPMEPLSLSLCNYRRYCPCQLLAGGHWLLPLLYCKSNNIKFTKNICSTAPENYNKPTHCYCHRHHCHRSDASMIQFHWANNRRNRLNRTYIERMQSVCTCVHLVLNFQNTM